jgi:hypothetical protein
VRLQSLAGNGGMIMMTRSTIWGDLEKKVPRGNLIHDETVMSTYVLPGGKAPLGVVKIQDVDMLMSTVRWARINKRPLLPVSSKPPHYHASLGMMENEVIVDFSDLKKVTNINRRNRVAIFEAGVTFDELVPLAYEYGLRVMLPLMPRRGKSALAAYLDREPVIYPKYQWDISDPLLCLEAVYGTGDLFRTGSAAGPGTIEDQWNAGEFQKGPMGPGQQDWMRLIQGAQGGIALATWCSAKCEVLPKMEKLFLAGADSIGPLVEAAYRQFFRKLTDIHFMVDRNALTNLLAKNSDERKRAMKELSPWNMIYSVSGIQHFPEERMRYLAREAEKELKNQGVRLKSPPLMAEDEVLMMLRGLHPGNGDDPYWRDRPLGAHRSVYFQTTMDRAGHYITMFDDLARDAGIQYERTGRYLQPQVGGRCCHLEFIVSADPKDIAGLNGVHGFCQQVAGPLIEGGAFFSRPHGQWAKPAMNRAKTSRAIFLKIKDIFDPDHILAPGRLMLGGDSNG